MDLMPKHAWHDKQFGEISRSTVNLVKYIESKTTLNKKKILDIGCGAGADMRYMGQLYPNSEFVGIEYDDEVIEVSKHYDLGKNVSVKKGDLYNIESEHFSTYDGIVCNRVLENLPDYKEPIEKMCELNADWICLNLLCFDGDANVYIRCQNVYNEHNDDEYSTYNIYNIYSLPKIKELFIEKGYTNVDAKEFEMDIDIDITPPPPGVLKRWEHIRKN